MPDARIKIDPALGTLPAGCVALKVFREKAGRWNALKREPDDDGGAVLPYFAPDEVPLADANAFAAWAREKWGPGAYRLSFWTDSGGSRKMAGTGRTIIVGAASKKKKKASAAAEKAEDAAPQTVLEVQLKLVERLRAELEEERRELREKRDRLLEQQLANDREHNRALLELVMQRGAAAAPAGPSATEVELRIKMAQIEARQEMAREIARAQERERRRQEEEEEDAPDPEDDSPVAELQRFATLAEKLGVLDMIKPHIAGLLGGAKGQA